MLEWVKNFVYGLNNYNLVPAKPEPTVPAPSQDFGFPTESSTWSGVVWHHSATQDGKANDWEAIRRYHTSYRIDGTTVTEEEFERRKASGNGDKFEKPWKDIGYHLGIEREGGVLKVRIGRPWTMSGAHAGLKTTNTFNEKYLGACAVGCFDQFGPDAEQWGLCLGITRELIKRFGFPKTEVLGHREVYDRAYVVRAKTCPGTSWDIDKFRSEL